MKKSDIKNGMHVITNDDTEYVIISGIKAQVQIDNNNTANIVMVQVDGNGWMSFDDYDDDLYYHDSDCDDEENCAYDIKIVYAPRYYAYVLSPVYKKYDKFIEVWKRPIIKKMTKAEIEEELGYEIEIVED